MRAEHASGQLRDGSGALTPPISTAVPPVPPAAPLHRSHDRGSSVARSDLLVPLLTISVILLGLGFTLHRFTEPLTMPLWRASRVLRGGHGVWRTLAQATRGHFATDLVATLAVVTAVIIDQPLPGLIVVLMQTGGEALEAYARGRASRAVRAPEETAPRIAHRVAGDDVIDVEVADRCRRPAPHSSRGADSM